MLDQVNILYIYILVVNPLFFIFPEDYLVYRDFVMDT